MIEFSSQGRGSILLASQDFIVCELELKSDRLGGGGVALCLEQTAGGPDVACKKQQSDFLYMIRPLALNSVCCAARAFQPHNALFGRPDPNII